MSAMNLPGISPTSSQVDPRLDEPACRVSSRIADTGFRQFGTMLYVGMDSELFATGTLSLLTLCSNKAKEAGYIAKHTVLPVCPTVCISCIVQTPDAESSYRR